MSGERERARQEAQSAFLASGDDFEVGCAEDCPLPPDELAGLDDRSSSVIQAFLSGLTARVYRLRAAGRDWTLKLARRPCLVDNVDGKSSFLNELQRRADFERLKREPGGRDRFAAIVDTTYGCLGRGILLSPWIEGETVATWDERRLASFFETLLALAEAGLFEWDYCPGNVLDDGQRLRLFDFGYMYRYDPLSEPNPNGWDAPVFHPAERFETRNLFAALLELELASGQGKALELFRLEKTIARSAYRRLGATLRARGASARVLAHLESITARWGAALDGDLASLYLLEGWRSHRFDVQDDLHGRTCTPSTLARLAWLRDVATREHARLAAAGALLWDDALRSRDDLLEALDADLAQARAWQVDQRTAPG
jgi:hypothetical protein